MKNVCCAAIALSMCAGGVTAAGETPTLTEPNHGHVVNVAHIYYNLATGEQVVTLLNAGQDAAAGIDPHESGAQSIGTSTPIWSSISGTTCPNGGSTTSSYFVVDDNAGSTTYSTGFGVADWGDIATDSVVDMVHVDWVSGHNDVDLNSDGIGDGVVGLGGQWTYWDVDNGPRADNAIRLPLISFVFQDLPGNISGDGSVTGYSADIDLAGAFSSSLTFEIGTTDHDSQGAAFFNDNVDTDGDGIGDGIPVAVADRNGDGLPDADIDGDGLFDWAWTVQFFQPGTHDYDGDGVLDGDLADSMKPIGVEFGSPAGVAVDNGDGTWTWQIDPSPDDAGTGAEDAYARVDDFSYASSVLWFGGFSCQPGAHRPRADFAVQLLGPRAKGSCPIDLNGDGVINFFDISLFIEYVSTQDPRGDLNHDGQVDFFDIVLFLQLIAIGCY